MGDERPEDDPRETEAQTGDSCCSGEGECCSAEPDNVVEETPSGEVPPEEEVGQAEDTRKMLCEGIAVDKEEIVGGDLRIRLIATDPKYNSKITTEAVRRLAYELRHEHGMGNAGFNKDQRQVEGVLSVREILLKSTL